MILAEKSKDEYIRERRMFLTVGKKKSTGCLTKKMVISRGRESKRHVMTRNSGSCVCH